MTVWEALDKEFVKYPMMVATGVPDSAISEVEAQLHVTFADAYRTFLRRYGGAMVGDSPILGLACADAMGSDLWSVAEVTERFRRDAWPGTAGWYIISVDGAGNPIGVDENGEVWLSDDDTGEIVRMAHNVEEFLRRKVQGE